MTINTLLNPLLKENSPTNLNGSFWNWFGDSKIVDKQGNPLVVYHGTDKPFKKVNMKLGSQGVFWFASDKDQILNGNSGASSINTIMEFYASIKNPAGWKEYDNYSVGELEGRGYDGVILPEKDGSFVGFIFYPNQVKSINNKGTWNTQSAKLIEAD